MDHKKGGLCPPLREGFSCGCGSEMKPVPGAKVQQHQTSRLEEFS